MILLRMFFYFGVEVLEGFEAWFLQSFFTSESWSPLKCLKKASIYRSLGVGKQHVAESDWWHMSQLDWSAYVIAYTRWTACVIACTRWNACVIAYMLVSSLTCAGLLVSSLTRAGLLMSSLTRAGLLVSSLTRADVWFFFCMTLDKFMFVSE